MQTAPELNQHFPVIPPPYSCAQRISTRRSKKEMYSISGTRFPHACRALDR